MQHVLLTTATMDYRLSSGVTRMFAMAHARNSSSDVKISTHILEGIKGYAHMRNRACQVLFSSPCDVLWFVDGDVIPPDDVFDLLNTEGDIVAATIPYETLQGAYLKLSDVEDLDSFVEAPTGSPVLDVTCVGTACTWFRREVLEDKRLWWPTKYQRQDGSWRDLDDDPTAAPPIFRFHRKPDGDIDMGEDWDLSYRASKLGYAVRLDKRIECDHLKAVGIGQFSRRKDAPMQDALAKSVA